MKRLELKWMGCYYDVLDGTDNLGEIYYYSNSFQFRTTADKVFTMGELRQILNFLEKESQSINSYR